jgi:integrase
MARKKKDNPRQMIDGVRRAKDLIHWEAAVFTGQYDEKGKPKYKWEYADSEKEAKAKRDESKYKIKNNIFVDSTDITLGEYLDEWIELYKLNIAETTYELYKKYIDVHIKPVIGDIKLQKIIPMTLKMFYKNRMETSREVKTKKGLVNKFAPLKANSIRKLHSLLHNALREAQVNNLILNNPADNVEPPKYEKFVPNILEPENYFKLCDAVVGTYDEIFITLAGGLGLRRGEVIGLRWEDVDFKNKTLSISQSITRFTKEVTKKPKNESSFRTIAAPKYILDILEEYKKNQKVIQLNGRICDKFKPQSYSQHFKTLLEKFNLPPVRYHDLRHFAAIVMMIKGIPDKVAAEILGHSQVTTLRKTYQHVIDESRTSAANTMDEFFTARK